METCSCFYHLGVLGAKKTFFVKHVKTKFYRCKIDNALYCMILLEVFQINYIILRIIFFFIKFIKINLLIFFSKAKKKKKNQ